MTGNSLTQTCCFQLDYVLFNVPTEQREAKSVNHQKGGKTRHQNGNRHMAVQLQLIKAHKTNLLKELSNFFFF